MVGTAAALTRDVNATAEGRMVHSNKAEKPSMTVTALRGALLSETVEIQDEKGRTPSRATAQIRRELATPATVVFCKYSSVSWYWWKKRGREAAYEHKTQDADDVHDDVAASAERHSIQGDERLRSSQCVQGVEIRCAEEKQYDNRKPNGSRCGRRPENGSCRCEAGVSGLFTDVSAGFEANQYTGCNVIGKHPVPNGRGSSFVVGLGEDEVGRLEAVSLRDSNGQPDDVEEKVKQDDHHGNLEDMAIGPGMEVVATD